MARHPANFTHPLSWYTYLLLLKDEFIGCGVIFLASRECSDTQISNVTYRIKQLSSGSSLGLVPNEQHPCLIVMLPKVTQIVW
jgi:hypothetical protein